MVRRSIFHVLLMLVLLGTQQLGLSHGISHWSANRGAPQLAGAEPRQLAESLAMEQACSDCLAFAQIGAALGLAEHRLEFAPHASAAPRLPSGFDACRRTVCPFQAQAPPAA